MDAIFDASPAAGRFADIINDNNGLMRVIFMKIESVLSDYAETEMCSCDD